MHKDRFGEILAAHGFSAERIDFLWGCYGTQFNEEVAHNVARLLAPISKDIL